MKITINTDVLQEEHLTMGEFLVMLMGFYNVKYKDCFDNLVNRRIISKNVFEKDDMVLSNNTRDWIANIILKSDERACKYNIDFITLAAKMMDIYPKGCKAGTTYAWSDDLNAIAGKLRTLVVVHNFMFTEEEALKATKEYVESYKDDMEKMQLLKYFILRTSKDGTIDSMFMTIIENNR